MTASAVFTQSSNRGRPDLTIPDQTGSGHAKYKYVSEHVYVSFISSFQRHPGGNSSNSMRASGLSFFAPAGGVNSECIPRRFDASFPALNAKSVLWCAVQGLAGDHQFTRDRSLTHLNPELPVGIEVAKGKVFTFQTIDDTAAYMLSFLDIGHEDLVRIRHEKVCTGQRDTMILTSGIRSTGPQCPEHRTARTRCCFYRKTLASCAVEEQRHISIAANPVCAQSCLDGSTALHRNL